MGQDSDDDFGKRLDDAAAHRLAAGPPRGAGFFTFPFDRMLGHWLFG
jgi:hypothetical protein